MKNPWMVLLIMTAVILAIIVLLMVAWFGLSYWKYSRITHQTCQGYDFWEDKAECAAALALEKNNPRYCRIDHFGPTGDACAQIYAEHTTDASTCKHIDLFKAKMQCEQRFR